MKNTIHVLLTLSALLLLLCCHSAIARSQGKRTLEADKYSGKLDQLLTREIAAAISGFDASKAVKEHENKAQKVFGGKSKAPVECNYLWSNGRSRPVTVGGNTITAKIKDKVGITRLSNTTLERFKRNYSPLTPEQKTAAKKRLEEEAGKRSAGGDADRAMKNTATNMIDKLQVEAIPGVAEAATWYPNFNELRVFYRGVTFSVVVDVSDDKSINRQKSIDLVKRLISEKLK
jgi:hypothetical protein